MRNSWTEASSALILSSSAVVGLDGSDALVWSCVEAIVCATIADEDDVPLRGVEIVVGGKLTSCWRGA